MSDFHIKKGDLLPKLRATLYNADGSVLDLTGATLVFRMRLQGAAANVFSRAATIVTPASGIVEYPWEGTDTAAAGVYDGEWVVTLAGKTLSVPGDGFVTVHVVAGLG